MVHKAESVSPVGRGAGGGGTAGGAAGGEGAAPAAAAARGYGPPAAPAARTKPQRGIVRLALSR